MAGQQDYKKALEILNKIQKNYEKLGRAKILMLHNKYISFVRKAAYKGNIEAQFELGLNYEDQSYFVPNPMFKKKRRFYWYAKAGKAGHPEACNNLASLYEKGEGTKKI